MRLLVFLLLSLAGLASLAQEPTLVLFGGGYEPEAALRAFSAAVEEAGGPLLILPVATSHPEDTGRAYQELFHELGLRAVEVCMVPDRDTASDPELLRRVGEAGGIWLPGGDQRHIAEKVVATPLHEALRALLARGGAVGGTSAGTACQGPLMLTGSGEADVLEQGNLELLEGLGLVPGAIVDQHFLARDRNTRLLSAVLEHPQLVGIGIDAGTAIILRGPRLEVVGRGWVLIYDARQAHVEVHDGKQSARGVVLEVLSAGQVWELE